MSAGIKYTADDPRDAVLEAWINAAWRALNEAATEAAKRLAAERMRELIAQRSPEQVERMERKQGLR